MIAIEHPRALLTTRGKRADPPGAFTARGLAPRPRAAGGLPRGLERLESIAVVVEAAVTPMRDVVSEVVGVGVGVAVVAVERILDEARWCRAADMLPTRGIAKAVAVLVGVAHWALAGRPSARGV